MSGEKLPNDLLWEGKHASELALSVFADGEEAALSNEIVLHLHTCNECVQKLGETALVTRGVTHAVQSVKPWLPAALIAPSAKAARKRGGEQRVPWMAVAAALVLTAVGAAPTVMALPHTLSAFAVTLLHTVPVISHSSIQVFQGLGAAWTQAMAASAVLLVAAGIAVTRLLPRPQVAS